MAKPRKSRPAALVTGAAKRIGREIALYLAQAGFDIALHYHRSNRDADLMAKMIKKEGGQCELFFADFSKENETLRLLAEAVTIFPKLNLLVNSASIFERSKFSVKDLKLYNDHFNINLKAPFILSSEFFRLCKKGQIINLIDTNIVKNKTSYAAYLLTKKSLADMTKLMAVAFAPQIRVNGICPGLILPPKQESPGYLDRLAGGIPLKRKGSVLNIIQSIEFLIKNDYLTGQLIFNDGGEHLV